MFQILDVLVAYFHIYSHDLKVLQKLIKHTKYYCKCSVAKGKK